ncbi:MAG: LamG domain-containing protein [Pyrinomonadaceae bacterium]
MYSSHLITGIDGMHYELWFSPSSLSYFKIRNQETGVWYAHDGSANDGRLRTSKEDWCRVIFYHMSGILKSPNECTDFNAKFVNAIAGNFGAGAQRAELTYVKTLFGSAGETFASKSGGAVVGVAVETGVEKVVDVAVAAGSIKNLTYARKAGILSNTGTGSSAAAANAAKGIKASALKGLKSPLGQIGVGLGVGIAVDYGVDAIKKAAGLGAKDANAGAIAAEVITTTVATTAITTAIMTMAGASFNPVVAGVGFLVAGGLAAGEEIAKASKDTGIRFEDNFTSQPRYNRDLNGIGPDLFPHENPPGTFDWEECATESGKCTFNGIRSVRYGAGDNYVEKVFFNNVDCGVAGFGSDPAKNVLKTCVVQTFPVDRNYLVKQVNNPAIYYQLGNQQHCQFQNMGFVNSYGLVYREVATLNLKGTNIGTCPLPNGFFKVDKNPQIWYLSGDGTSLVTGKVIGNAYCSVPSMDSLTKMGGADNYYTLPAGSDITSLRKDMGVCPKPFNGTSDYISLPPSIAAGLSGGNAITVEYWFLGSSLQSAVRLQNGTDYIVAGWGDTHILSNDQGAGKGIKIKTASNDIYDQNWHHIAMSWEQGKPDGFKSYVDGVVVDKRASANVPLPIMTNITPTVGAFVNNGTPSEFAKGQFQRIRIWNVARTEAQIRESRAKETDYPTDTSLLYQGTPR